MEKESQFNEAGCVGIAKPSSDATQNRAVVELEPDSAAGEAQQFLQSPSAPCCDIAAVHGVTCDQESHLIILITDRFIVRITLKPGFDPRSPSREELNVMTSVLRHVLERMSLDHIEPAAQPGENATPVDIVRSSRSR